MKSTIKQKRIYLVLAGVILVLFGLNIWIDDFYLSSWLNVLFSMLAIVYSVSNFRKRLGLFFFISSLNLFLIARPIIDILNNFSRHLPMHYNLASGHRSNLMVSISILAIILGQIIYERYLEDLENKTIKRWPSPFERKAISWLSIAVGMVSFYFLFLTVQEKILFRANNTYTELYSDFSSNLPFIIQGFSAIAVTMVILIVVTTKNRMVRYGALIIYVGLNAILMKAGVRADFTKIFLFALFVLIQRELLPLFKKKDLGIIALGAVILFGILAGVFHQVEQERSTYTRKNDYILPIQLIYDQSISYMTLNRGQELKEIEGFRDKNYTFGPFLDNFGQSRTIKRYTMDFVEGGDSLAADIAYYLYGENAFKGYGLGSSYIIEVFNDFGYLGLMLFSMILGILLGSLSKISWNNMLVDVVKLRILAEIFYIPRAPATQFLVNILVPQFLLPVLGSLVFAKFLLTIKKRGWLK